MRERLHLVEDDVHYYDAAAAERAVRFIENYCCHYEDRFAGKPFTLIDWQKQTVRDLFGWKRRADRLRRFRELYLEIAKGSGKTPLLAAIGLYMFLADGEQGPQIWSVATDLSQANLTFDAAKRMIRCSPRLRAMLDAGHVVIHQYLIEVPKTNGTWGRMSGQAEGKHGFRPTCVCGDEVHEWKSRKLYDDISSNMHKRSQPLMLLATNAGEDKESICWELHERARKVLEGESEEGTLYPVIYAADENDDWSDPAVWKKAQPSLGIVLSFEAYRAEYIKARENPALEARFKRLYLSLWVQGSDKWLDMNAWDACATGFSLADVLKLPCYLGLDLSQNDDLCALVAVWVGEKHWFCRKWCWIPKRTATKYEEKSGIRYSEWAAEGLITIVDQKTVDERVKRRILRKINLLRERFDVKEVCYDPWRANEVIAGLEEDGATCVPVDQKFNLTTGCQELERRLTDRSIVFKNDPCFRWQAGNAEVMADKAGNIKPVKSAAKGKYKGLRSKKIDALVALVTTLCQVRRKEIGGEKKGEMWDGSVEFV